MKKNILIGIFITFIFMVFSSNVEASSGTLSIYSASNTVVVGNSVTVTATISSGSALGSWEFCIGYDTSKLRLTSSNTETGAQCSKGVVTSSSQKSKTYTFTFRATASGSAQVNVSSALVYAYDESVMYLSKGSKTFTLRTQAEIEASYSKNNYLSSLSIDGVSLTPEFNKDTLEYAVELVPETAKINVNAAVADGTAALTGTGEREVTEGDNNIQVVVTAQNGTVRTYSIKVTVKEYNPITVEVDENKYTVVRKKTQLTAPNNYSETTIKISDEEVPAFKSDITNYTLVALKDEKGNQNFYIYEQDKYKLYKEYSFNKIILYPMELDKSDIPEGYKKSKIVYNNQKIIVYKLSEKSSYSLIYSMNVETGTKDMYMYDDKENTVQIYNDEYVVLLNKEVSLYLKALIGLGTALILSIGSIIFILIKNKKKKSI